ncbi:hypothetical protein ACFXG4_43860 [Nocardia sp. NPDC059246]|uniref:hypothetical protein n=1 Tax=unclassified Nocardia TaxID=2637762 RepID=UPI0036786B68
MDSPKELKEQFREVIAELSRTSAAPGAETLEPLRQDLARLDGLVRKVPDDRKRYELGLRSREAHSRWEQAWSEFEHPTILGAQPSPLERSLNARIQRDRWEGFER